MRVSAAHIQHVVQKRNPSVALADPCAIKIYADVHFGLLCFTLHGAHSSCTRSAQILWNNERRYLPKLKPDLNPIASQMLD